jgi:hypothetical protein
LHLVHVASLLGGPAEAIERWKREDSLGAILHPGGVDRAISSPATPHPNTNHLHETLTIYITFAYESAQKIFIYCPEKVQVIA